MTRNNPNLQRYEILSIIGEGAYGSVYKARRKTNNEVVAIKKFKDNIETNNEAKPIIMREVKMLRKLQHPDYVVALQDQFKRRGRVHLVFEYIDKSLLDLLEDNPTGLPKQLINSLLIQLLKAIEWCHKNNIIHRDIKPENLLVNSKTYQLKLCDFGFARSLQKNDDDAVTAYVATRWYRAPELLVGTNRHTTAVDMWPVGCIWIEMCSAEPIFPGDSEIDQLYIIQETIGQPLPPNLMSYFKNNAEYSGLTLPNSEMYTGDPGNRIYRKLQKRHPHATSYFKHFNRLEILTEILQLDPDKRINVKEALYQIEHPNTVIEIKKSDSNTSVATLTNSERKSKPRKANYGNAKLKKPHMKKTKAEKSIIALKLPKVTAARCSIVGGGGKCTVLSELLDSEGDGEMNDGLDKGAKFIKIKKSKGDE